MTDNKDKVKAQADENPVSMGIRFIANWVLHEAYPYGNSPVFYGEVQGKDDEGKYDVAKASAVKDLKEQLDALEKVAHVKVTLTDDNHLVFNNKAGAEVANIELKSGGGGGSADAFTNVEYNESTSTMIFKNSDGKVVGSIVVPRPGGPDKPTGTDPITGDIRLGNDDSNYMILTVTSDLEPNKTYDDTTYVKWQFKLKSAILGGTEALGSLNSADISIGSTSITKSLLNGNTVTFYTDDLFGETNSTAKLEVDIRDANYHSLDKYFALNSSSAGALSHTLTAVANCEIVDNGIVASATPYTFNLSLYAAGKKLYTINKISISSPYATSTTTQSVPGELRVTNSYIYDYLSIEAPGLGTDVIQVKKKDS